MLTKTHTKIYQVKKESPLPPEPAKPKKGGKEATKRKLKGSDSEGDEQDYEKSKAKKSLSSKLAEKKSSSSAKDSKSTPTAAKESKSAAKDSKSSAKDSKSSSAKDDRRKSEPRGNSSRSSSRAADKRRSEPVKAESINGRSKRKSEEGGGESGRPKRRASRAILEIDYIKSKVRRIFFQGQTSLYNKYR